MLLGNNYSQIWVFPYDLGSFLKIKSIVCLSSTISLEKGSVHGFWQQCHSVTTLNFCLAPSRQGGEKKAISTQRTEDLA